MNHYAVKSREAYLLRRLRGNVNNKPDKYGAAYFALFDRNEELPQVSAARHAPAVRALMADMLRDPRLADLQEKALSYHRASVETLRESGDYDRWIAELDAAGAVSIDRLDEVLFTHHLPKDAQETVRRMQADGVPDKTIARMIARSTGIRNAEKRQDARDAAELAGPRPPTSQQTGPGTRPELTPETRKRLITLIRKARETGRAGK